MTKKKTFHTRCTLILTVSAGVLYLNQSLLVDINGLRMYECSYRESS